MNRWKPVKSARVSMKLSATSNVIYVIELGAECSLAGYYLNVKLMARMSECWLGR
jgi:hypothetical protein